MSLFSEYPGLGRVPNFVGLDFNAARQLQTTSGWSTRNPGPDAPPISNYWWDHQYLVVASQDPAAGELLSRGQRIAITLTDPPLGDSTRPPAGTPPTSH